MNDPWAFGWTQVLTIVGLLITIGIAFGGFRTFGRFKREKIEERRIEVALDALALAYEAKFRFEGIRSRIVREDEYEDIDERPPGMDSLLIVHGVAQRGPYAVLKRLRDNRGFFERVYNIEPKFMAVFGAETEKIFELLYNAKTEVETAAQVLFEEGRIEHDPSDADTRERLRQLRLHVFASSGKVEPEDNVGQLLMEFQERIETLCRPIIDATFGKKISKD